jgi:SnoaL-like domain
VCDDVAIDVHADSGRRYSGGDAFVASVQRALADAVSVHHGHMPEIELTSSTSATGIWAMEDELWFPEGAPVRHLHGYGHYHETYRLEDDGRWRIATLRLERLRRDVIPRSDQVVAE